MDEYTYPTEFWRDVFNEFRQVERVKVDSLSDELYIKIKDRPERLKATQDELDDTLYKFKGNPREVVAYFLKKHGVLIYYHDTLVGYFDIISYSSYIDRTPIEESIQKVSHFFKDAGGCAGNDIMGVKTDHWILSDSIIVVVDTNRHPLFAGSIAVFLDTCSSIMAEGMRHGLPLRGAIGGGDFYKDGEVMVSSALVDAARYEKEQEWLGAVLTPTALQLIEKAGEKRIDLLSEKFIHSIRHGAIPWKKNDKKIEKPAETYYIKPFDMAEKDWASKYLPKHFNSQEKIKNSHCLYAQK